MPTFATFLQQCLSLLLGVMPCLLFLLTLHAMRRSIGRYAFAASYGVIFAFSLICPLPRFAFSIESIQAVDPMIFSTMAIPIFAMLLVFYETNDTTQTLRLILGMTLVLVITEIFLALIPDMSYEIATGFSELFNADKMPYFLEKVRLGLFLVSLTHLITLFALPILYQFARNIHIPVLPSLFICCLIIFGIQEAEDAIIVKTSLHSPWSTIWLARYLVAGVIAFLGSKYAQFFALAAPPTKRHTFSLLSDIVTHFITTDNLRRASEEWEEQYRTVLNHSSEFIFLTTADGALINANLASYSILGLKRPQPLSLKDFITFKSGECFDFEQPRLKKILESKIDDTPLFFSDMHLSRNLQQSDTICIDFNLSRVTLRGKSSWLLIARDVTAQREQEKERQKHQEQFIHSQRLEALGTLAGGIAHDFNNLLHSMQASLELLETTPLPKEASEYLSNISDGANRASKLTGQLLGFARKGNFSAECIDLSVLIQETASLFKSTAKNIAFKTLIEPTELSVFGDSTQLQQTILNLLINARDAVRSNPDDRPAKIVLRAEKLRNNTPEWSIRPEEITANWDHFVCVKIKDNGSGIPDAVLPHIFEPFYTTKEVGKGTGMGLAMVYGCVTKLGGWIHVSSQHNIGTTFTLVLPYTPISSSGKQS